MEICRFRITTIRSCLLVSPLYLQACLVHSTLFASGWLTEQMCKLCACRLVLELCTGTLTDLLRRVNKKHKHRGLPVLDVVVLGITLADAVLAVHEFAHSLHLDIKPENVLLRPIRVGTDDMQVAVLTDFGLMHKLAPRVQDSLPSATRMSLTSGVGEGTPGFAAPE